ASDPLRARPGPRRFIETPQLSFVKRGRAGYLRRAFPFVGALWTTTCVWTRVGAVTFRALTTMRSRLFWPARTTFTFTYVAPRVTLTLGARLRTAAGERRPIGLPAGLVTRTSNSEPGAVHVTKMTR